MMRYRLLALTAIVAFLFPLGGHAVDNTYSRQADETESAGSGEAMTEGLVKKVDKDAGKVTIRHGPIEKLGMPQMTMIFRVKDPAMLDRLQEGDKILFIADKVNGAFTVMRFEPVK
jgi:Cu(I)/Ag(I) efflux system protein CusF